MRLAMNYFLGITAILLLGFFAGTKIYMGEIGCNASTIYLANGKIKQEICSCFHKPSRFEQLKLVVCQMGNP